MGRLTGPGAGAPGAHAAATAADALRQEETSRTRTFLGLGLIVALAVVPMIFVVPGDRRIATALVGVLGTTSLGALWVRHRLGPAAALEPRALNVVAFGAVTVGVLGILYVGMFSAAPIFVALGLLFFCRTEHFPSALGMWLLATLSHTAICALVIGGVMEDPGFYPARADVAREAQIATAFTVQQMYALSFLLARLTRQSSLRAIEQLQHATRLAAMRDVQVAELQMELDRARKIGGPGRFTGHVVGAWELGAVLGRGAMGEVYEASHVRTGAHAAVKLLRRELLADPVHVERFFREVRIAGAIDSPHVVRVLEASSPHEPIPFLAMERLHGRTLGELLRSGPVTGPPLSEMVAQVARALDLASAAAIVHRDLKPHNLFLTDDGVWKVLDFGVAILAGSTGTLTRGAVIGTPAYMAPEQAQGQSIDHRADVYSLGAVIYRCLTGRLPFVARDTPTLLYAVVHQMPLRPSAVGEVSPELEALLAIALAKAPDERFQSAGELAKMFGLAVRGQLPGWLEARARALLQGSPWAEPVRSSAVGDADQ